MTTTGPDVDRLAMRVVGDRTVDGRPVEQVVRTHSAELWFVGDVVVKRKRPVDLGFLDFTTASARAEACRRELDLNRRLADDVYRGLVDIVDADGAVVDTALVMQRLPDSRRLEHLARSGADLDDCVRAAARRVAAFHAGQPPAADARAYAGPEALRTNWDDNLAVLRDHPELADPAVVAAIGDEVHRWLDGRGPLLDARIDEGLVRDGHGDLVAADVFCMPDGPEILDCLDFADHFRIGDVLLDIAFLAMDLERIGRPDLAAIVLDTHATHLDDRRPNGLAHHYVAYRASVRAKVACLADDPSVADVTDHLQVIQRHLAAARVRLVLVGGLPGTGKSTLAAGLAARPGWTILRSDEVRKDLVGVGHQSPAAPEDYGPQTTAATYAELLDRAHDLLARGETVVLDATWSDPLHRRVAADVAARAHADLIALQTHLPAEVARDRLARRRGDVSDAGPGLHDTLAASFAPWPDALTVSTLPPPAVVQQHVADALALPPAPTTPEGPAMDRDDQPEDRPTDRQGLEVLDPEACRRLLDLSPVGRVAFVVAGEPVVLPVNHLRDGSSILFRTASGLTLDAATRRASMAFEVDGYDEDTRTGWSVLVRGTSDIETDKDVLARLDDEGLHPWADVVDRPHWVRIRPNEISGRRILDRQAQE